jgi:hypothetical protein
MQFNLRLKKSIATKRKKNSQKAENIFRLDRTRSSNRAGPGAQTKPRPQQPRTGDTIFALRLASAQPAAGLFSPSRLFYHYRSIKKAQQKQERASLPRGPILGPRPSHSMASAPCAPVAAAASAAPPRMAPRHQFAAAVALRRSSVTFRPSARRSALPLGSSAFAAPAGALRCTHRRAVSPR